jgi:hypothetical protein
MATNWIISDVTNALKSNVTPGADDSYRYSEAGLSQQACTIKSETSLRLSCWNVDGANSNLSYTVVMEEGRQNLKDYNLRRSSNVKLFSVQRRRVTAKPLQFLELMKHHSTVAETQGSDQWVCGVTKEIQ